MPFSKGAVGVQVAHLLVTNSGRYWLNALDAPTARFNYAYNFPQQFPFPSQSTFRPNRKSKISHQCHRLQ
ncbi:MAG: hypothetical protein IMZ43_09925 [Thermoplasmata archaeon]|nr:hypothetical protein [Thermoplasmata archaeon]